jgi:hypothetical protein
MTYTLGEAAKATGMSKAALSRSIKNGRLSAEKQEDGSFKIDPAELHRVYPVQPLPENRQDNPSTAIENARLKATIEGLEKLCSQIEGERDSLREQNTRLTALLTDQRTKQPSQEEPAATPKRNWWPFRKAG